jgi:hypothetical protein
MNKWLTVAIAAAIAAGANAQPNRPSFTKENRFPGLHRLEAGGIVNYRDNEMVDYTTVAPYARYGLLSNLTLNAAVPFESADFEMGDSESGLGDIQLGLDLLAWQDIFDYPWVIPHVAVGLPTGDEDKGLGTGETTVTPGLSAGSKMYDWVSVIFDVSYAVNGAGTTDNLENAWLFGGSVIWDISERFAILAEAQASVLQDSMEGQDDTSALYGAGLSYDFTENFELLAEFGTGDGENEGFFTVKGAYTF